MIEVGNVIIDKIQPSIEQANAEFAKLGDIGWDVVGATLKDNSSAVFNLVSQTFDIAARAIEMRVKLVAMNIKNELASIIPFSKDNSETIAEFSRQVEIQSAKDAETMGKSWAVTYKFLVDQAQQRADAEIEIQRKINEQKKELAAENLEAETVTAEESGNIDTEKTDTAITNLNREGLARKMAGIQAVNQSKEMISQGLSEAEAAKFVAEQKMEFEANILAAKLGNMSTLAGALSSLNSSAKGSAKLSKRLAQGEALINTYAAANVALKHPAGPPWSFIAAAAVIAAGLANVVKIESTEFAQGGIVPGAGNRDTVPAMLTPGEVILNQSQQENLVGGMGGITINVGKFIGSQENADELANIIEERARLGFNRIAVS